VQKINVI